MRTRSEGFAKKADDGLKYVIDASVVLKWFFREEYSIQAESLLERLSSGTDEAHAPELLLAEAAHVLRKRRAQHKMTMEEVWDRWAAFIMVPIEYAPIAPLMLDAFAMANERSITAYDALYAQLAIDLEVPVITADGGLWATLGGTGKAVHIRDVKPY